MYELICVQTIDFQVHVLKACDKGDGELSGCIRVRFENFKDLYVIDVINHISSRQFKAHR